VSTQDLGPGIPVGADWAERAVRDAAAECAEATEATEVAAGAGPDRAHGLHHDREQRVLERIERARARRPKVRETRVTLAHGAGGWATHNLVEAVFLEAYGAPAPEPLTDSATLTVGDTRLAFTTDSFVVSPLFFPGGDIGSLAVHGTVNDVAMAGAKPLHLAASFIIEEGFPFSDLARIARSMGRAAEAAGVAIITGDTKVVERGKADGLFISTCGVGVVPEGLDLSGDRAQPGDAVILSGTIGDHGVAVMSKRENLEFETEIVSDSAALHDLVAQIVGVAGSAIRLMRDPTRGGLAASLNEIAHQSGVGMRLDERAIPVKAQVAAACELLGLDPLNVANEGKLVAIVAPESAEVVLAAMRSHALGSEAAIIGTIVEDDHHFVQMTTAFGGGRIVDWLAGEQLPRIC
jgi:hydrogenase expression/formation protein HypE